MKKEQSQTEVLKLWKVACHAYKRAYAPYSHFPVGAAFQVGNKIFSGCNIENASFGATLCAERVALAKAISEQSRTEQSQTEQSRTEGAKDFKNLVIVTSTQKVQGPCGLCLQVMAEFAPKNLPIYMATQKGIYSQKKLKDFLPYQFTAKTFLSKKASNPKRVKL